MSYRDDMDTRLLPLDLQPSFREGLRRLADCADAEIATLRAENAELQRTFDLHWDAQMRAVAKWREAHPGNELVLPDTANLTLWLLERAEAAEAEQAMEWVAERHSLRSLIRELADQLEMELRASYGSVIPPGSRDQFKQDIQLLDQAREMTKGREP